MSILDRTESWFYRGPQNVVRRIGVPALSFLLGGGAIVVVATFCILTLVIWLNVLFGDYPLGALISGNLVVPGEATGVCK